MSYILDALKKSERQRQAIQPGTVTDRILVEPPQTQQRSKKWLIVLGVGNLCALILLFWFFNKKPALTAPSETVRVSKAESPTQPEEVAANNAAPAQPIEPIPNANEPQVVTDSNEQQPSIADMMGENNSVAVDEPRPNASVIDKKNVPLKKPPLVKTNRPKSQAAGMLNPSEPPPRYSRYTEPESALDSQAERPKMTINVFSYAPRPEDRFVMINMTKYKVGQLINNGIKLKAINSDHIVLQQGGATYKVDRP